VTRDQITLAVFDTMATPEMVALRDRLWAQADGAVVTPSVAQNKGAVVKQPYRTGATAVIRAYLDALPVGAEVYAHGIAKQAGTNDAASARVLSYDLRFRIERKESVPGASTPRTIYRKVSE
jgi:hypothetical protein